MIETCGLNCVDPQAWLSATLTAIVKGHKQSEIDDLLPCNYAITVTGTARTTRAISEDFDAADQGGRVLHSFEKEAIPAIKC